MAENFERAKHVGEASDGVAEPSQAVEAAERKSRSLMDAPATYCLLAINVLVFLLMLPGSPVVAAWGAHAFGASLTAGFDGDALLRFGGCYGPAVLLYHQWWRLLTAAFVHGNVLHIAVNMWCLWNLGLLGEPLLGRQGLIATYVLTGIAGNLCSLAFLPEGLVVGASGAVFGIAGILIVLLSNKKLNVPWEELKGLRRSVIQFAVLNLVIGMAPGFVMPMISGSALSRMPVDLSALTHIDNFAHLGGLVSGLLMGLAVFPRMMWAGGVQGAATGGVCGDGDGARGVFGRIAWFYRS